jgi:hypothetical protein
MNRLLLFMARASFDIPRLPWTEYGKGGRIRKIKTEVKTFSS